MTAALAEVPGPMSPPVVGHTVPFLRDALGLVRAMQARYGDAFRLRVLGREVVVLVSPDATRDLYLDRDRALSSEQGWAFSIGPLFARGLMLRDLDDHHRHRLVMAHAFRRAALASYVERISAVAQRHVAAVGSGPVDAYALVKRLMLDVGAMVFVGAPLGQQATRVNADFVAMMRASLAPVRLDVPGTAWHRGMVARRDLVGLLDELAVQRREEPERADLLSRLVHARDDDGRSLPMDEVVDHLVFLLLAAHDTTTATVAVLFQALARHPAWQDRVATEVAALDGAEVTYDSAGSLVVTGLAMREAMRLQPPVPFSPRVAVRDVTLGGVEIPAGKTGERGQPGPAPPPGMVDQPRHVRPRPVSADASGGQSAQPRVCAVRRRSSPLHWQPPRRAHGQGRRGPIARAAPGRAGRSEIGTRRVPAGPHPTPASPAHAAPRVLSPLP